jgi:hypothetical protein
MWKHGINAHREWRAEVGSESNRGAERLAESGSRNAPLKLALPKPVSNASLFPAYSESSRLNNDGDDIQVIEDKSSSERNLPGLSDQEHCAVLESTLKLQIEESRSRESRGPLPVPAGVGYPVPLQGAGYPAQPPDPVPPPAAPAPMLSKPSAPPPPMLRDSSEFQTIVSGTNPLDRLYKASKQKERQNIPLEDIDYSKKHGYRPTQEESYQEPPNRSSQEPSPLDRIYRAQKEAQKELEKQQQQKELELQQQQQQQNQQRRPQQSNQQQQQSQQRRQQQSNNRQKEEQKQRNMFPKIIPDFYSTNVPTPPTHLVRKMNDLSDRLYKASSESSTLHQVGNWEVKANSNAKVPELSDEQPLPNVKKYLKPQIKMAVKNVEPSDQTKIDTHTNLYSSVKQLFQCQPCWSSEKSSEDFQNHLASAHHK